LQSPYWFWATQAVELAVANAVTMTMVEAAFSAVAMQAMLEDSEPFLDGNFVVYPAHSVGRIDRVGVELLPGIA
jgi:hypothetical protein